MYLLGHHFTLIGDDQPLAGLLKPGSRPPARIVRWLLRLQCFDFTFKYRPGHWNPIDVLSRKSLITSDAEMNSMGGEQYIRFVVAHAIPKTMTLDEICKHTMNDKFCTTLINAIKTGQWSDPDLAYVRAFRYEFSYVDNIVLRSNRITIPATLQSKVLRLAHHGHQGMVKRKQYLRTKVWWLGMDSDVEKLIKGCLPCLSTTPAPPPAPHASAPPATSPWQRIHLDFLGPYPTGEILLVATCAFSHYIEADIFTNGTSFSKLESRLDPMFARQGYCQEIVTDNGPPFCATEFKN